MKIKVKPDGSDVDTSQMKYVVNPFDEIALEEALRLSAVHGGEIVVVSVGPKEATAALRSALAMGADRAELIVDEGPLDPFRVTELLLPVVEREKPDLILLGKQAVDDDMGQVGSLLAERLGLGQVSFASKEESLESENEKKKVPAIVIENNHARVVREIDGGQEIVQVALPAVITVDLCLNLPRYTSLPGLMKAKKKEIKETIPESLQQPLVRIIKFEPPQERVPGVRVADVATLVDKLHSEAHVI